MLESRPVAAISWLNVVRIRPSGDDRLEQPLDGLPQPGDVAVPQQVQQERVLGLDVELLQRVGVGGVAGLGALGLGHPELVEEHHLQLLGRAEVDLLADDREGLVGGELDLAGELRLERLQLVDVDGDAGLLHPGQQVDQRQLDVGQQPGAAAVLELLVQRRGQVEHGARVQHLRSRRRRRPPWLRHPCRG